MPPPSQPLPLGIYLKKPTMNCGQIKKKKKKNSAGLFFSVLFIKTKTLETTCMPNNRGLAK